MELSTGARAFPHTMQISRCKKATLSFFGLWLIFPIFHTAIKRIIRSRWLCGTEVTSPTTTTSTTTADKLSVSLSSKCYLTNNTQIIFILKTTRGTDQLDKLLLIFSDETQYLEKCPKLSQPHHVIWPEPAVSTPPLCTHNLWLEPHKAKLQLVAPEKFNKWRFGSMYKEEYEAKSINYLERECQNHPPILQSQSCRSLFL